MTNNKFYLIAVLLTLGMVGFSCPAMAQSDRNGDVKNRWSVHAAVNLSHRCENPVLWNLDTNELIFRNARFGWGVGAMIGANYDIRFNRTWSLTPGLDIQYVNNGAEIHSSCYDDIPQTNLPFRRANVIHSWNITIPVLMNMRAPISRKVGFRVGAGPYLTETFYAQSYIYFSDKMTDYNGGFGTYFNLGIMGEMAVETGNHFSYFYRVQYPFLKDKIDSKVMTMSLGVAYTF
jgi:hypothetical protein